MSHLQYVVDVVEEVAVVDVGVDRDVETGQVVGAAEAIIGVQVVDQVLVVEVLHHLGSQLLVTFITLTLTLIFWRMQGQIELQRVQIRHWNASNCL